MLYKFLFPSKPDGAATSAILLIVRIIFGVLLMNHGIEKWSNYQELSAVFPDPLGVGSPLSIIRKTKRFAIPERAVYFLKTKRTAGGSPPPQNIFDRLTPVFT